MGHRKMKDDELIRELVGVLEEARDKIKAYQNASAVYPGGPLLQTLIPRIDAVIRRARNGGWND